MSLLSTLRRVFGRREQTSAEPLDVERLGLNTWLQTAEFIADPGHEIPWLKWFPQIGIGVFARAMPCGIEYQFWAEWSAAFRWASTPVPSGPVQNEVFTSQW